MRKKYIAVILVLLVIFAGAAVLYRSPAKDPQQVWEPELLMLSSAAIQKEQNLARWYNRNLRGESGERVPESVYTQLLDFGAGKMGYLEIPSMGIWRPIIHENKSEAQTESVIHSFGTALPVGGKGNCPVLLCGGENTLAEGDLFCLHVLDTVLTYQVADIGEEPPENAEGEDLCVLSFCSEAEKVYVTGVRMEVWDMIT